MREAERITRWTLEARWRYYQWPLVRTNRRSDSAKNTPNSLSFLPVQVLINHVKSPRDHLRRDLSTIMTVRRRMGEGAFRALWRARLSDRRSHPPIDDLSLKQSTTKLHGHVATVEGIVFAGFHNKRPYTTCARIFAVRIVRTKGQ